jgi:dolichol kinase
MEYFTLSHVNIFFSTLKTPFISKILILCIVYFFTFYLLSVRRNNVSSEEEGVLQMLYSHGSRFWKNKENLIYQHLLYSLSMKKHMTT